MKYVLAIYTDESYWPELSDEEQQAEVNAYWQVDVDAKQAGVFIASEPLAPTAETTVVTVREGETVVTDGPFAETKEQLGGFYLLDCDSREQALEFAAKIPGAARGRVEVRPVVEYEEPDWVKEAGQSQAA